MQKEKSDCPTEIWLSAKICLPDGKRGFAVGKLIEESDRTINLLLTLDQNLIGNQVLGVSKWNSTLSTSQENLANLPKGTAILLAPPRLFGVKFWIARIGEPQSLRKDDSSQIIYKLLELKKLKNFLEARSSQRIIFRTSALLVDPKTYTVTQFYTHDISHNGLSLIVDQENEEENAFEVNENYLFQLQLHEGLNMPALNYRCVHIREDILTGTKLIGFALNDRKAKDPDVEYNLTLLTWSDSLDNQEFHEDNES